MSLVRCAALAGALVAFAPPAVAQDDHGSHAGHSTPEQPAPSHAQHDAHGGAMAGIFGAYPMTREASGTAWQPDAATHGGIHWMSGDWMLMGHLNLLGVYDNQSGPRGDEKFFIEGMAMLSARRTYAGGDNLNLRVMLSPDPFMGRRGYPLLLAAGETADGVEHLIDRQHPHELFMELSASYTHMLSDRSSLFLYLGYPGEPAIGPPAFMHRVSGMALASAPITHHWLDSTHIVFGVATLGFVHDSLKFEVSQFTGREPDENRYDFDRARFDSTSARVTWNPNDNWSLQVSWAAIESPEQLEPERNEDRFTASASYAVRIGDEGLFAATAAVGVKHLDPGPELTAFLLEASYKPVDAWTFVVRAEWAENPELSPTHEIADVSTVAFGVVRDFRLAENWKIGVGAQYAFNFVPHELEHDYGRDPHGTMVFLRLVAE
jgi:hypothetical protein